MAKEIPWETREAAEQAYILDGMTYEQTAAATGVSVSQLRRWGQEGGWTERKREYRAALRDIELDKIKLRRGMLQTALETMDPQAVYAVARLEQVAAAEARNKPAPEVKPALTPETEIRTPGQAVEAMRKALEIKVNGMLSMPDGITLKSLKELKESLALWEKVEAQYTPEAGEETVSEGLSDQAADEIKRQILGIKS